MIAILGTHRHWLLVFILTSLLALTAGCGGQSKDVPAQLADTLAPDSVELPRPSEIPRAASAPPTMADLYRDEMQYDSQLPRNRTSSIPFEIEFTPDWDPGDYAGPEQLAYIGYRFINLTEYAGPESLKLGWQIPPPSYQYLWLAVANFSSDIWQWEAVPTTNLVSVANFSDCISGGGELYALVLLAGKDSARLDWILVGDHLEPVAILGADLNPDKSLRVAPLTVNFSGLASFVIGGEIVAWDFDFDDDGNWDVEGDETGLAQYEYTVPGATTCRLRVHDDIDQQAEATVDFWVVNPANVPPTATFTANPANGPAPLEVLLDASGSTDDTGIRSYEWDLDNDGDFEVDAGDVDNLDHIFGINGLNTVTLRVTDLDYATATHSDTVTVTGGFQHALVAGGVHIAGPMSAATAGTGVNQRACVAWQEYSNKDLKFSIASNIEGSAYNAPIDPVSPADGVGYGVALSVQGAGYPMIAYGEYGGDNVYDLFFVRATNIGGTAWDTPVEVGAGDHGGGENALVNVFGKPSIATIANYATQSNTSLVFYQATDGNGANWSSGITLLEDEPGDRLFAPSIVSAIVGFISVPVVCYFMETPNPAEYAVGVMRGLDQVGSSWTSPVVFTERNARRTSLAIVAGYPALAGGSHGQVSSLYYGRAGDVAGDTWPDGMTELLSGGYGGYCDLEVVNGVPAICFYSFEGSNLWYMDAADANGETWNDPFIVASSGHVGQYCSMAVIDYVRPVIFHYNSDSQNLMAAYWLP